jgi:hypothetical protein
MNQKDLDILADDFTQEEIQKIYFLINKFVEIEKLFSHKLVRAATWAGRINGLFLGMCLAIVMSLFGTALELTGLFLGLIFFGGGLTLGLLYYFAFDNLWDVINSFLKK